MLLNSNQISEYIIESEFSKRAQIGIDLSVCKVEQVNAGSEVYLDGTKIDGSAYHEVPLIKEKPIKNIGKVAIIIPTKGNVNMLYECVKSFYDHCNQDYFEIFIADTGSTDSEKEWIQNNILNLGFINFIEYDYYNFAKINRKFSNYFQSKIFQNLN